MTNKTPLNTSYVSCPSSSEYYNHPEFKYFAMAEHTGCVGCPSSRQPVWFDSRFCQR